MAKRKQHSYPRRQFWRQALGVDYYTSGGGEAYSEDAETVFALMPDPLTTDEKNMIAGFVDSQILSGNWELIRSWRWHGFSEANSLINWKDGVAATKLGTPGHDPSYGFRCDGDNTIDTIVDLTSDSIYTQNNALFGAFLKTKRTSNNTTAYLLGTNTGNNQFIAQISGDENGRINSTTSNSVAGDDGLLNDTFYLCGRIDSGNETLYRKTVGEELFSRSVSSTSASLGASRRLRYCTNATGTSKMDADVMAFILASGDIDVESLLENFEFFF